jgi:hypothetical protein
VRVRVRERKRMGRSMCTPVHGFGQRTWPTYLANLQPAFNLSCGSTTQNVYRWSSARRHNMSGSVSQGCIAAHRDNPSACATPQANYAYIKAPFFVLNSMLDNYQMSQILQVGCSSITECNTTQIDQMKQYQTDFRSTITNISTFNVVGNGAFLYNCDLHCGEQDSSGFNMIAVPRLAAAGGGGGGGGRHRKRINWSEPEWGARGIVMQAALSAWWESDGSEPALQHTYVEQCTLQGPHACNPTCPAHTMP